MSDKDYMTVKELANIIQKKIREGSLSPDAIVVRPFCFCDIENGYVIAQSIDEISMSMVESTNPPELRGKQIFTTKPSSTGTPKRRTVKLG